MATVPHGITSKERLVKINEILGDLRLASANAEDNRSAFVKFWTPVKTANRQGDKNVADTAIVNITNNMYDAAKNRSKSE